MSQMNEPPEYKVVGVSNTGIIWICYVLHTLSVFFGGVTSIIAVFINYLNRDSEDRLMASHMAWQIRTFWLFVVLAIIFSIISFLLFITVALFFLVYPLWFFYALWFCYRQIKGMLALNNGKLI